MFTRMKKNCAGIDYELVMVTNQGWLGYRKNFRRNIWPVHNLVMCNLESEGIHFNEVLIDRTFPEENAPTKTGYRYGYQIPNNPEYDIAKYLTLSATESPIYNWLKIWVCKGIC